MKTLLKDLQEPKRNLTEFGSITNRVLNYMSDVISDRVIAKDYIIYSSTIANTKRFIRPIRKDLFIFDPNSFYAQFEKFMNILSELKQNRTKNKKEIPQLIDKVVYTMQESIGIGLDLLSETNSSRKHVGNRFEELVRDIFDEIGIANRRVVLKIPYQTESGKKEYNCEIDLVLSPYATVHSDKKTVNPNEIVVSVKTTTKDRMSKIFIDKLLIEHFIKHEIKFIAIALNDIQRKGNNNINYTFVSNLFMVYTEFLTKLEGFYYLDLPQKAIEYPFKNHIFQFSKLLTDDIWEMIS